MSKLAVGLRCEPSNVTGLVDRLEKRGLVERRTDAHDRRVKLIAPTAEGSELSARVWADLNFAAEPLRGLEHPERIQLRDLLRKMRGAGPTEGQGLLDGLVGPAERTNHSFPGDTWNLTVDQVCRPTGRKNLGGFP